MSLYNNFSNILIHNNNNNNNIIIKIMARTDGFWKIILLGVSRRVW